MFCLVPILILLVAVAAQEALTSAPSPDICITNPRSNMCRFPPELSDAKDMKPKMAASVAKSLRASPYRCPIENSNTQNSAFPAPLPVYPIPFYFPGCTAILGKCYGGGIGLQLDAPGPSPVAGCTESGCPSGTAPVSNTVGFSSRTVNGCIKGISGKCVYTVPGY